MEKTSQDTAVRERHRNALLSAGLAAVVLAVYAQVWGYGFVEYDDPGFVTDNPMVRRGLSAEGVRWAFTTAHMGSWNPVTWLSHMLDVALFGLNPGAHHLSNVALHVANTVLLFAVLRRMTRATWPSLVVAALFGVHPLHVESVAWISERKDVLSTLFWMLTLWAYAHYAERRSRRWYAAALGFFAVGLMAKPMLVTLPFVLLLLDWWPLQRLAPGWPAALRPLVWEKLPFFGLTAAFSAAAYFTQRGTGAMVQSAVLPAGTRMANALVAYVRYLGKTAWPVDLAVLYPYEFHLAAWTVAAAAAALAVVTASALRLASRHPYLAVGWLWYAGTLVPVIGFVQIGNQALADRYTYIPLIGIFIATVWGARELAARWAVAPRLVAAASAALIAALAAAAAAQVACWRDGETLLAHTVRVTRDNYVAHNNLGAVLWARGDLAGALAQFQTAVRLNPEYADAHDNLGLALAQQGRGDEAIAEYRLALRYRPESARAHNNFARLLASRGDRDQAIAHLREAIRLDPQYVGAHLTLGNVLRDLGRNDDAAEEYRQALRIAPDSAEAHNNLGALLGQQGRTEEALAELRAAVRYDPRSGKAHTNLGLVLRDTGKTEEALAALRRAVELAPDSPESHYQLALALNDAGDRQGATEHFARAVQLRPDFAEAHNDLGVALTAAGRLGDAIGHFREALRLDPELPDAQYNLGVALTMQEAAGGGAP
jgi:tetratricopeptide (TPR) repeat protein